MRSLTVTEDRITSYNVCYTKLLRLSVIASIGGKESTLRRTIRLVPVKYPEQALTLPPKMVTPPAEVLERIRKERAEVLEALNTVSPQRMWWLPLERPVEGQITSLYGLRRVLNGKRNNFV